MHILFSLIALFVFAYSAIAAPSPAPRNAIWSAAEASVGKKMWFGYGLPDGTLGCAAALCNVLNKAGCKQAHSAGVRIVYSQLKKMPGVKHFKLKGEGSDLTANVLASQTQPGDVLLAFNNPPPAPNTGSHAHCGIIGPGGQIYTNDWNDGIWKLAEYQRYFSHYKHVYIFRIPSAKA